MRHAILLRIVDSSLLEVIISRIILWLASNVSKFEVFTVFIFPPPTLYRQGLMSLDRELI